MSWSPSCHPGQGSSCMVRQASSHSSPRGVGSDPNTLIDFGVVIAHLHTMANWRQAASCRGGNKDVPSATDWCRWMSCSSLFHFCGFAASHHSGYPDGVLMIARWNMGCWSPFLNSKKSRVLINTLQLDRWGYNRTVAYKLGKWEWIPRDPQ